MSLADDLLVERFRTRVAEVLDVAASDIDIVSEDDLMAFDGYEVAGKPVDSLQLVDLVTVVEDEFDVSLQDMIDRGDTLTLRGIVLEVAARGGAAS
jgi:acyl carrier protein